VYGSTGDYYLLEYWRGEKIICLPTERLFGAWSIAGGNPAW